MSKPNEPRINRQITAQKIRLVGANGEMIGVVGIREGIIAAQDAGLDLVEISPNAEPPVCKILDYGKFKYEEQKRAAEARKKQKIVHIKEIKLRPMIGKHDLEIKIKQMHKFLEDGDKVKVSLRFRGREMSRPELGHELMDAVKTSLADVAKVEYQPKLEGQMMIMVLGPAK